MKEWKILNVKHVESHFISKVTTKHMLELYMKDEEIINVRFVVKLFSEMIIYKNT